MSEVHKFDRINAFVAGAVLLLVFIVYYMTKAPTLSFWDCGEFIAAASILGVPHPPGTPLYVLIANFFTKLPLSSDIAVRVNMLSVISSALAAMFGYLITVRLLRACFKTVSGLIDRVLIYAGGFSGAMFLAFSLTNWNNAVETEVYGLSMMMIAMIIWLSLIYYEKRNSPERDKYLLLLFYIAFAGIGVHLTTYLVIPGMVMMYMLSRNSEKKYWFILSAFVAFELYLIFALSSRPDEIPIYLPVLIVFVFYLFYIFSKESIPKTDLLISVGFILAVLPVAGSFGQLSFAPASLLTNVGIGALLMLTGYAVYLIYNHLKKEKNNSNLISALFILSAVLMVLLLLPVFKGYKSFLLITVLGGLILLFYMRKNVDWSMIIAIASVSMVVLGVKQFFLGLIVGLVLLPILGLIFKLPRWKTGMMIVLVALIGYSSHLYLPIRSAQDPMINENDPSTSLEVTINFIERKQYGSQSMVERMFQRRGEWENQFGNYQRMGFWHFFDQQYGLPGLKFILLFVLGLFGLWEVIRYRPQFGLPFLIFILITSVGLVLYMNFADGTRMNSMGGDYIEVRDRDYFFTPAYMFFGLLIGAGIANLLKFAKDSLKSSMPAISNVVVIPLMALFLLPSYALTSNYWETDRSRDHIPYQYAKGILDSTEPNGILFTVGDNDTFPIWCLQEAYGYRKDVAVVNFSLARAPWYIKQLRDYMGVKFGWTEEEIDNIRPIRDAATKEVFYIDDLVTAEIIKNNYGKRPINFCVTNPHSKMRYYSQSLDSLLQLRGMVWVLDTSKSPERVDIDKTMELLMDTIKYDGINDTTMYRNETTLRVTLNYVRAFKAAAEYLRAKEEYEKVDSLMSFCVEKIPHANEAVYYLGAFYADQQNEAKLAQLIEKASYADKYKLMAFDGQMKINMGKDDEAIEVFQNILNYNKKFRPAYDHLMRIYYKQGDLEKVRETINEVLSFEPDDAQLKKLLESIEADIRKKESGAGEQ